MEEGKDLARVTDRMRTLCSRREYCSAAILKKAMAALDGDRARAEAVVAKLIDERYIDDLRYSSAFARDKSSIAGWGETKIRYMLSAKGISRDTIAEALKSIDEDKASGRLEKLMESKARSLKGDPQFKLKMLRFGMGRGYSYEAVTEVTDKIMGLWKDSED
jgi:regulatory protein